MRYEPHIRKHKIGRVSRLSPKADEMQRVKDKDGTVWLFVSPSKRNDFENNRQALEKKSVNFLSPREIKNLLYGGQEL